MLLYSWYPAARLAFEAGSVIDMRLRKIARSGARCGRKSFDGHGEGRCSVRGRLPDGRRGCAAELVRCIEGILPQTKIWDLHERSPTVSPGSEGTGSEPLGTFVRAAT
jgi:hypothetical protein